MIKAAIFDLDGTLADTMPDLKTAMNGMLRHYGWPERSREELRQFINRGARVFVSRSMPEGSFSDISDDIVTEALKKYSECYAECFNDETCPYDGIIEALDALKSRGMKLGVLSNKQDAFVRLIIERLFPDTFEAIMGHGKYPEKPAPDAAFAVAEMLGAEPAECVFIGDSDIDMKTAVNAGMYPLGVGWGYREAEILLDAGARYIAEDPQKMASHIAVMRGAE